MEDIKCSSCGTTQKEAQEEYSQTDNRRYFFENCFGGYTCQGEECVYEYVMEHNQVDGEQ